MTGEHFEGGMAVVEYAVVRSEDRIVLRRQRSWSLVTLASSVFPIIGLMLLIRYHVTHPFILVSLILDGVLLCGFLFVFYKLAIWGRCVVLDKRINGFSVDGQKWCALSEMSSVTLDRVQPSDLPFVGTMENLTFRTLQGKCLVLKSVWTSNPEYRIVRKLAQELADFADAASNSAVER